jgi:hypothetical protein
MALNRLPSVVDYARPIDTAGTPTTVVAKLPARVERFNPGDVASPELLAAQLTRLHQLVQDSTAYTLAHPRSQSKTFRGVTCSTAGAKVPLPHGFGRRVFWTIVGWKGNGVTAGPDLVSDEDDAANSLTDDDTLWLRSYTAGTADIEVHEVP